MKRKKSIQRIIFILLCIAIISTGIYARVGSVYSGLSYGRPVNSGSSEISTGSYVIGLYEISGDAYRLIASAIRAGTLTGVKGDGLNRTVSDNLILSEAALYLMLLITWKRIRLNIKRDTGDGMELIHYIHNSDGKKRG